MAKKNRSRDESDFEGNDNRDDVLYTGSPFPGLPETHLQSSALLDEILMNYPHPDSRARQYLLLLRHQLETDESQFGEARQALEEFEEVYNKLTQPANRIGVYIHKIEDGEGPKTDKKKLPFAKLLGKAEEKPMENHMVAVGDQEFIVGADPMLEDTNFAAGTRVKVNEAYVIVGDLGPATNGPVVKISEVLDDGRLRVSMDSQGMQSRLVYRGDALKELDLKAGDEVRMEPNFKVALERFGQAENKEYFLDRRAGICRGRKSAVRKKRFNSSKTPSNCRFCIPNFSSVSAKSRSKAFCFTARRVAAKP